MNLDKRIKRHIIGSRLNLFAVTLPGYEALCRQEIGKLSDTVELGATARGGVAFSGRFIDVYRANLHLRTAGRILIRLASFTATNFHQLEKRTATVAWSLWLPAGAVPACHVTAHHSRLYHSRAIADRIRQQVAAHWSHGGVSPAETSDQALFVRLQDDRTTLSLDSSGAHLYRRGLKSHDAKAPLRETTAAIILQQAGFRADRPLVDPMCGAGTFSLEAALMAKAISPGLQRRFAFMQWPAFRPRQWAHLTQTAAQEIQPLDHPMIWASDLNADACKRLAATVAHHRLQDAVRVRPDDFFSLDPSMFVDSPGLIVLNPPYGRRLTPDAEISRFYQRIVAKLQHDFRGWRVALIAPQTAWARRLPLRLRPLPLDHGGLKLILFAGKI